MTIDNNTENEITEINEADESEKTMKSISDSLKVEYDESERSKEEIEFEEEMFEEIAREEKMMRDDEKFVEEEFARIEREEKEKLKNNNNLNKGNDSDITNNSIDNIDVDINVNEIEENDKHFNKHILMGLSMKGLSQQEKLIQEKKNFHNINDFLKSETINKKTLEIMFYSNSLKTLLGEDYLEKYEMSDVYQVYKNIAKNNDFNKMLKKSKNVRSLRAFIKKNFISKIKFAKEKTKKKIEQEGLFSFNLNENKEVTPVDSYKKFLQKHIYGKENTFFDIKRLRFSNHQQETLSLFERCFEYIQFTLFQKEILKQLNNGRAIKSASDIDYNEIKEKTAEMYETFLEEVHEIKVETKTEFDKKELSNKEYNSNIKKFINVVGFIDDLLYGRIKEKYKEQLKDVKVEKISLLSKFISGNENFKKEIFNKISTRKEKIDLDILYSKVNTLNEINELKILSRQKLKKLSMNECVLLLLEILKTKRYFDKNNAVFACLNMCGIDQLFLQSTTSKLHNTLKIIYENKDKTKKEKETITINDLTALDDGSYKQISLTFENKVKYVVIELFTKMINEYIFLFKKQEEFNKEYSITTLGYIKGGLIFDKGKNIVSIFEKGKYGISIYTITRLFDNLEGIGLLNIKLNWKGGEKLDWIKFLSLQEDYYYNRHFSLTTIGFDEIHEFKSFKSKLIKLQKKIAGNYAFFHDKVTRVDDRNNYVIFSISKKDEYGEPCEFFASDGEVSCFMNKQQMNSLSFGENVFLEEKDFISTIQAYDMGRGEVKVKWVDDDGQLKTNIVLTNLKFEKEMNYFEKQINKGFLGYYLLYFKKFFDESEYLKTKKGMIIFDLETIGFTGNILLSYFLYIGKYKGKDCVILKRHSNSVYGDFFDKFCSDADLGTSLTDFIEHKLTGEYLLSGHNTIGFDNKRLADDMYNGDFNTINKTKEKIDKYSVDTLKLLEESGFGKIGLDTLSKINFDFGKNITKQGGGLMETINEIVKIIKGKNEDEIKKNFWKINKFVLYNKNDVLMSTGLLGQMLKYGKIATPKGIAYVDVKEKIKNM